MRKFIKTSLLILASLFATIKTFAQNPTDFGGDPNDNPLDTPAAPIDNYLWILVLVGILFAFIFFRTIYKHKIEKQSN